MYKPNIIEHTQSNRNMFNNTFDYFNIILLGRQQNNTYFYIIKLIKQKFNNLNT